MICIYRTWKLQSPRDVAQRGGVQGGQRRGHAHAGHAAPRRRQRLPAPRVDGPTAPATAAPRVSAAVTRVGPAAAPRVDHAAVAHFCAAVAWCGAAGARRPTQYCHPPDNR